MRRVLLTIRLRNLCLPVCCVHMSNTLIFTVTLLLFLFSLRLPTLSRSSFTSSLLPPTPDHVSRHSPSSCSHDFVLSHPPLFPFLLSLTHYIILHFPIRNHIPTQHARKNSKAGGQQSKLRLNRDQALQVADTFSAAIPTT